MAFKRADILLPKFAGDSEKMKKWSVVACDQYTSEPDYWKEVSKITESAYSTLFVTVPEIYLNDSDIDERIKKTNATMDKYMAENVFEEYKNAYIFVERTLRNGVKRLGIMGMVDLEEYDFSKESKSKIRATEGTVISRIPPRLKVRRDAPVELPHIMLLIDDASKDIIESNAAKVNTFRKVYDFDLMQNSGHITGYLLSDEAADELDRKLTSLSDLDSFNKKYGVNEASPLVYAMGDGNHSLATAKTNYENLKKEMGDAAKNTPARYALCELVNLHDDSLVFEAIHRVVFNADADKFIKALDDFIAENGGEVDYIHGEDVVINLSRDNNFGIILEAMDKSDLYKSVILDGALPRKTFSMGDACDKRFYTEARKIK